jgi:hypothetical protein
MKKITLLLLLLTGIFGYAQPSSSPSAPTNAAADVISVFGDTFTNIATNYDPNWGQSGFGLVNNAYDTGSGELVLAYPNFNYQGTEITTQDASSMEFLHVDIWTAADPSVTIVQVSPINDIPGGGTGANEILVTIPHTAGTWTSVDLPIGDFTGMTWDNIFQMKFAANGAGSTTPADIYLDNVYFWKTPAASGTDATLSDLQVDMATVTGFSPNTENYPVELPIGTTVIPQITSATTTDSNATVTTITQASALPGDATVLVTAQDGTTTKTYTVSFSVATQTSPLDNAPDPTAAEADVISIFSGVYTDVAGTDFNPNWGQSGFGSADTAFDPGTGNLVLGYPNFNYQGNQWGSAQDISAMEFLHVDIWVNGSFNPNVFVISSGAEIAHPITNTGSGTWISVDIPVAGITGDLTNAIQFKFDGGNGSTDGIYVDNLYFWKNTLSVDKFDLINVSAYPNPSSSVWNVKTTDLIIDSIQVYNVLGKVVYESTPNTIETEIDASSLSEGLYFAKVYTDLGSKTVRLIKK